LDFKEKKTFRTKWHEYRYGDWRKGSGKVFVTLETAIPELPKVEVTAPDEAAFHKRQVEIDDKIKDIIKGLEERKVKFFELVDHKKAQRQGRSAVMPKEMKEKFDRLGQLNKRKKKIYEEMDAAQANNGELTRRRELLNKKIHKQWNTSELVPKGIKEIRKKLETTSGTHNDEARLIKEIKVLQDSLPFIKEKEEIDAQLQNAIRMKKQVSKDLPSIIQEIKKL
jgi:uncharacterized coiled-coil DUF342 family protein